MWLGGNAVYKLLKNKNSSVVDILSNFFQLNSVTGLGCLELNPESFKNLSLKVDRDSLCVRACAKRHL